MGPILLEHLSRLTIDGAGSRYTNPADHTAIRYSAASRESRYAPRARIRCFRTFISTHRLTIEKQELEWMRRHHRYEVMAVITGGLHGHVIHHFVMASSFSFRNAASAALGCGERSWAEAREPNQWRTPRL
jgi:hypothetical protein